MKKRKPAARAALPVALLLALALLGGCTGPPAAESSPLVPVFSGGETAPAGADIALILTESQRGGDFPLAVWNEITRFAGEQGLTCGSYQTEEDSLDAAMATLELAVTGGARLVVASGDFLGGMVARGQREYEDLSFILLDSRTVFSPAAGTVRVRYPEEQAGWMAGYAAVWDDAQKLAFQEGGGSAWQRYALGFLVGAEQAAEDRHLDGGSIQVLPLVPAQPGPQAASPAASSRPPRASSLVSSGGAPSSASGEAGWGKEEWVIPEFVQPVTLAEFSGEDYTILFANDPDSQPGLYALARLTAVKMITLEEDLGDTGGTVVSVVQKAPGTLLAELLLAWKNEEFPGGRELVCGVEQGGILLDLNREGFERFNDKRYEMTVQEFETTRAAAALERGVRKLEAGQPLEQVVPLAKLQFYAPLPPADSSLPEGEGASVGEPDAEAAPAPEPEPPAPESASPPPEPASTASSRPASAPPAPESAPPAVSSQLPDSTPEDAQAPAA